MVTVKNLSKIYGETKVVKGISFEVQKGEIFGILGPNGAGKTTTLEMMEALRPIDGGSVTINGIDVSEHPQKIRQIIGVQPQSPAFQDKTKLTELLELFAAAYGEKVHPKKFLEEVGLLDKAGSYVEQLSGGQKQRLAIARILLCNTPIVILDEPTSSLDKSTEKEIIDLLMEQCKEKTVLWITHHADAIPKDPRIRFVYL